MKYFERILDLRSESQKKSLLLFGPRQTGKSFLLKKHFPESNYYNLLHSDEFIRLAQRPQRIREEISALPEERKVHPVIIDEIQKLPVLLDEVHAMIEEFGMTFIVTGSSPRKLKRGSANLLGGRARTRKLFPLVYHEIPDFDLVRVCNVGSIPSIYLSDEPRQDLLSYCGTYLKEEVQAEGLVRKIENFSRFLEVAALADGELLNIQNLANDTGVSAATLREYISILEDTLLACVLKPFKRNIHRKSISTAKLYLFDIGVSNVLAYRRNIQVKSELFGKSFEHLIHNELFSYLSYRKDERPLTFWRDRYGHEVDFIIGDEVCIEVKASDNITGKHLKNIRMLGEEVAFKKKLIVSLDHHPRKVGDITILPWQYFLSRLWEDEF